MRIIGGEVKGRKIETLDRPHLRPMLDRVRENLFNIIQLDLPGADVLDLFSGCGSIGIEALSRGASGCTFVESDSELVKLIERNLIKCGLGNRGDVLREDVLRLPARSRGRFRAQANIVFADPPYALVNDEARRRRLFAVFDDMVGELIVPGARLVLHHEPMDDVDWPTRSWRCCDRRVYGNSQLSFFDAGGEGHESGPNH
ncbi:MAG: 16S rRNA (guanine(966)-N(2))-methyltransferase RsmD [Planctomycetota bacterium]